MTIGFVCSKQTAASLSLMHTMPISHYMLLVMLLDFNSHSTFFYNSQAFFHILSILMETMVIKLHSYFL